jgi:hypothetical protein
MNLPKTIRRLNPLARILWILKRIKIVESGCWCWIGSKNNKGYGYPNFIDGHRSAHRLSFEIFVRWIPKGKHVLHRCDNPKCVNPFHLFLGTNAENQADAARKNRKFHKLTLGQVKEIRALALEGVRQKTIATTFGINRNNVSRIISRERRAHVN